ncbi:unnamed protein product [Thelazia callipaeda]|uniref:Neur_chan_LBD domain-containing protein n=1 Tax=Thelazia callipaeda TaxID=103827 RepID=A0A0N5D5W3_THECL|nr:unnamed protein product [Thelazia callipaeda]
MQIVETPIFNTEYDEIGDICTSDKKIIENLLNKYKTYKTPSEEGVIVWVEVWVQEVNSVNEITSDFDLDIYVTELWIDNALRYDDLNPCKYNLSLKQIWKPNTVFINSKSATIHKSPFTNLFLMIYPNGTVWYKNYRVQIKGPCQMDFTSFPMDEQTCLLTFESFNYNNQEVDMQWISTKAPLILLKDEIILPDFVLTSYNTSITYPAGVWNELTMTFTFTRRYGWYIFQAYVPTYLTIFISWISFCLSSKMIPARTMLGVNSLLALTFHFGNIMRNLPRVSYVKALDVWMLSCLSFVFCSLLELAVIGSMNESSEVSLAYILQFLAPNDPRMKTKVFVASSENRLKTKKVIGRKFSRFRIYQPIRTLLIAFMIFSQEVLLNSIDISSPNPVRKARRSISKKTNWTADRIDRLSIILFPSLFTIFNIIYWSYYLSRTKK